MQKNDIDSIQVDLHCHSRVSDGGHTPKEVVQFAHQNGAKMMALTDHDHLGGIQEAKDEAARLGMTFISGVEVSTTWQNRSIHVVGLNFSVEDELFAKRLQGVRAGRHERLQRINERFEKLGIMGVYEGALSFASNPEMVGRSHVARFLIQEGVVKNTAQAFKKYLAEGKSAYVAHDWADFGDAVRWIKEAGGLSVIAHPGRYKMSATKMRTLIEEFKALGGDALEVASSSHAQNEILNFALLAERYDLLSSSGSDFHVLGEGGRVMGRPPELPKICRPIWQQFDSE